MSNKELIDRAEAFMVKAPYLPLGLAKEMIAALRGDNLTSDSHYYTVLICAVRYCLGRRTYMPGLVTSWIMGNAPELPAETALIMLRDINDQRRMGERIGKEALGDPCDVKTWEKFEAWLQGRISQ